MNEFSGEAPPRLSSIGRPRCQIDLELHNQFLDYSRGY
jgi:hypothetical protein